MQPVLSTALDTTGVIATPDGGRFTNIVRGVSSSAVKTAQQSPCLCLSAKLSNKWYEIDIGWFYIRVLETFRSSTSEGRAPRVRLNQAKTSCDMETLHAVYRQPLRSHSQICPITEKTYSTEIARLKLHASDKLMWRVSNTGCTWMKRFEPNNKKQNSVW